MPENLPSLSALAVSVLACAQCKSSCREHMAVVGRELCCRVCGAHWPIRENNALDFRVLPPKYAQSMFARYWQKGQDYYESWARSLPTDPDFYHQQLQRSQSLKPLLERFVTGGVFLDVAGSDGRFRQLLPPEVTYISLDAFLTVREDLACEGRLAAYPVLAQPCDFVCGLAEQLPFQSASVDTMRCNSSIQYFWDPLAALNEMRRVLKPGARLLLGVPILQSSRVAFDLKQRIKGLLGMQVDTQLYQPTKENLLELIALAGLEVSPEVKPTSSGFLNLLLRRPVRPVQSDGTPVASSPLDASA